jgi:hypothetical protein
VPGGNTGHPGNDSREDGNTNDAAPSPVLDPELVRRFHALIEEVTDQLVQSPHQDRNTCRADAITLLIATSKQMDDATEPGESPLMYLLLEEQQKAAAALATTESPGHPSAFLRA